jgi:signal transduction histidine kinase
VVESAAQLTADPTLLARALSNLIDNARDHGGGLTALVVRTRADRLQLIAEDDGPGFPAGEEEKVFAPFYRSGDAGSLGLGLALVRRIAEAHGGRAFAENREQRGARVILELPLE